MNKPQAKRYTFIRATTPKSKYIGFEATDEAFTDMKHFLTGIVGSGPDYSGYVSGLYDFDEVVEYIRNWQPADLSVWDEAVAGNEPTQ